MNRMALRVVVMVMTVLLMRAGIGAQNPPLTMGSLIVRATGGKADGQSLLVASAAHADAGIRAVAARIAAVRADPAMAAPLISALSVEPDPYVAAEQVRALLLIGTPEAEAAVEAHLATAEAPAVVTYSLRLARVRPTVLLGRIQYLVGRVGVERARELAPAVVTAAYQHPAHRVALLRTWLAHAPADAWVAALQALGGLPTEPAEEQLLVSALEASDGALRTATVWQVLDWLDAGYDVSNTVLQATRPRAGVTDPWETVGRDVLWRQGNKSAWADHAAFLRSVPLYQRGRLRMLARRRNLTSAETSLLRELRLVPSSSGPSPLLGRGSPHASLPAARMFEQAWPGLLVSLFEQTGCAMSDAGSYGLLRVSYGPDGRPQMHASDARDLSRGCAAVLDSLGTVSLADEATELGAADEQTLVLLPVASVIQCADRVLSGKPPIFTQSDAPVDPEVASRVVPTVPPSVRSSRRQATAIVDALVGPGGCVAAASVRSGTALDVAVATLMGQVQTRYQPLHLNGAAFAVQLAQVFNFSAQ